MALFEIRDLTFTYPQQPLPALKKIRFSVREGEFLVICGKSGCGKSTLLRHFKTSMSPYGERQGEILLEGRPLPEVSVREQAGRVGYVLQSPDDQLVTDKVWHELAFGLENLGYDPQVIRLRVAEMASYFGIQSWYFRKVSELSSGQKQLLNLASVMAMQPDLLVLDEPTSQLDPLAAGDFLATLRKINVELGTTIILIEHRLEEVLAYADRVMVMEDGGILALDEPRKLATLIAENDMFRAMPTPMRIFAALGGEGDSPVTVREGREWLAETYGEKFLFRSTPDGKGGLSSTEEEDRGLGDGADTAGTAEMGMFANLGASGKGQQVSAPDVRKKSKAGQPVVLETKDVWFRYERNAPDVVRDLNMQVREGELYCLLGGNGAGKSTALSLLGRLRKPYRGKIFLRGQELGKYPERELYGSLLGILPQNPQCLFVKDTVEADLREILGRGGDEGKLAEVVEKTEIRHLLNSHPYDLSGGEQQRAALAKVLLKDPQLILLDEPTKGLDGFYKQKLAGILAGLKAEGKTILMVSHDIEFCAEYGDTCALFFQGGIVTSCPAKEFFAGNSFYTTAANRMVRKWYPDAVTAKDVIERCRKK